MPNNVTNKLTVSGAPDKVKEFFAAIDGGMDENGLPLYIDFNKIKLLPEALRIECGSRNDGALALYAEFAKEAAEIAEMGVKLGDDGADAVKRMVKQLTAKYAEKTKDDPELLAFGEQLYNNIRNYGAPTWYEWSIHNWGTKWIAYNQERLDDNTIMFDTANSDVCDLIQELSGKYPDVKLSYEFAEEQWGIGAGAFEFEGGDCAFELVPADYSEEARTIAGELLGDEPVFEDESEPDDENEDGDEWEDEL